MSEPLPCPFCGHVGLDFEDGSTYRWGVASCGGCGASTGEVRRNYPDDGKWHAEAIKEWNRRAQPAQAGQALTDDALWELWNAQGCDDMNQSEAMSFARAIEQAVLAKRVPQWLPIETAPQDWGVTKFDVWANDARFADCWWGKATYEQGEPGIVYQSDYDCNGPVDSYVRNATHWMPLPPPPGIVGEKGGA